VLAEREEALGALSRRAPGATALPGEGWSGRIAPGTGEVSPQGPSRGFLVAVLEQLRARARALGVGMECAARPAIDLVRASAGTAAAAVAAIETPLLALSRALEATLDEEADTLNAAEAGSDRGRAQGLDRRARMILPGPGAPC